MGWTIGRRDGRRRYELINKTLYSALIVFNSESIAAVRAGLFPREVAVEPDRVALVSNFASDQLEAVNVSRLR